MKKIYSALPVTSTVITRIIFSTIMLVFLGLMLPLFGCSPKGAVTPGTNVTWTWEATPGNIIPGAQWAYLPLKGADVEAGRTLSLTWSANTSMDCYIFTETQYNDFIQSGIPKTWMAHGADSQGTITTDVLQNSGKYFGVLINNTTSFGVQVKLNQATLTEQ